MEIMRNIRLILDKIVLLSGVSFCSHPLKDATSFASNIDAAFKAISSIYCLPLNTRSGLLAFYTNNLRKYNLYEFHDAIY